MEASEIPGFHPDEELEEKLEANPDDLSDDTFLQLQRYKSRKLQAKRDAGMSEDSPSWSMLKPGDGLPGEGSSDTEAAEPESTSNGSSPGSGKEEQRSQGEKKDQSTTKEPGDITEYYSNLKETIPDESSRQDNQQKNTEPQEPAEADSADESAPEPQPDTESIPQNGSAERAEGRSSESSPAVASSLNPRYWAEWIRDLEEKLLHKQEKIARLREENARLKERISEE